LQVRELKESNGSHSVAAAYGGKEKYTHQTLQEMCLEEEKGAGDGTETSSSAAEGEGEDGKFLCRGRQIYQMGGLATFWCHPYQVQTNILKITSHLGEL